MIVRVKTGEETNKKAKQSKTFVSIYVIISVKIGIQQVLKIKETKNKKVVMFLFSIKIRRTFTQQQIVFMNYEII